MPAPPLARIVCLAQISSRLRRRRYTTAPTQAPSWVSRSRVKVRSQSLMFGAAVAAESPEGHGQEGERRGLGEEPGHLPGLVVGADSRHPIHGREPGFGGGRIDGPCHDSVDPRAPRGAVEDGALGGVRPQPAFP